jgi:hypothetical protein
MDRVSKILDGHHALIIESSNALRDNSMEVDAISRDMDTVKSNVITNHENLVTRSQRFADHVSNQINDMQSDVDTLRGQVKDYSTLESRVRQLESDQRNNIDISARVAAQMRSECKSDMQRIQSDMRSEYKSDMSNMKAQHKSDMQRTQSDMRSEWKVQHKSDMQRTQSDMRSEWKSDVSNMKAQHKSDMQRTQSDMRSEWKSDVSNMKAQHKSDIQRMQSDTQSKCLTALKSEIGSEVESQCRPMNNEIREIRAANHDNFTGVQNKFATIERTHQTASNETRIAQKDMNNQLMKVENDIKTLRDGLSKTAMLPQKPKPR